MLNSPARSTVRQDVLEMIRLIRTVQSQREVVAAAGQPTAEIDALLRKLRNGLRLMLPLRSWSQIPRRAQEARVQEARVQEARHQNSPPSEPHSLPPEGVPSAAGHR